MKMLKFIGVYCKRECPKHADNFSDDDVCRVFWILPTDGEIQILKSSDWLQELVKISINNVRYI